MLSVMYPEEKWNADLFLGRGFRRSTQRWLRETLKVLFPGEEILEDFDVDELILKTSDVERPTELDLFLPQLKLGFEFQGSQHYEESFSDTHHVDRQGST